MKSINSTVVNVVWKQPTDVGGCPIIDYTLMIDDGAAGNFTRYNSTLKDSTFNVAVTGLTRTLTYRFKVVSRNQIGSTESNVVSALVADVPAAPLTAPTLIQLGTNTSSIRV